VVEQRLRGLDVVALGGGVEGDDAAALRAVGVGSGFEQRAHGAGVARGRGGVDGADAELVVRVALGVGAVPQQRADGLLPAEERSERDGVEALGGASLQCGSAVLSQGVLEEVGAAGGSGLERVEVVAALGLDGGRDLWQAVEEREQQRRAAAGVAGLGVAVRRERERGGLVVRLDRGGELVCAHAPDATG
jgi:hypothetical protein